MTCVLKKVFSTMLAASTNFVFAVCLSTNDVPALIRTSTGTRPALRYFELFPTHLTLLNQPFENSHARTPERRLGLLYMAAIQMSMKYGWLVIKQ